MENSQLVAIIERLDAMMKADTNEVQSRRFEREGQERGFVTYDPATQTFELEELATHQKFDFDDIDRSDGDLRLIKRLILKYL